jgi:hypothetical protein
MSATGQNVIFSLFIRFRVPLFDQPTYWLINMLACILEKIETTLANVRQESKRFRPSTRSSHF